MKPEDSVFFSLDLSPILVGWCLPKIIWNKSVIFPDFDYLDASKRYVTVTAESVTPEKYK